MLRQLRAACRDVAAAAGLLAVLYAPSISLASLHSVDTDPQRGTTGAVIGYPGGESETVVPAAVSGTELARGYNIYGDALVTRSIAGRSLSEHPRQDLIEQALAVSANPRPTIENADSITISDAAIR